MHVSQALHRKPCSVLSLRKSMAALATGLALATAMGIAHAADSTKIPDYVPSVGQEGKDVVWVPTSQDLVNKMLDMAKVTPKDYLIDLGAGDGRTVITAAQRGLRANGIEYNPDMVKVAQTAARRSGVEKQATFEEADLFKSDLTQAQVITLFLLPSINEKLRPTILDLKPGTRIVSNSFRIGDWEPDQSETVKGDCSNWCTAHLWIVPAKVVDRARQGGRPMESG